MAIKRSDAPPRALECARAARWLSGFYLKPTLMRRTACGFVTHERTGFIWREGGLSYKLKRVVFECVRSEIDARSRAPHLPSALLRVFRTAERKNRRALHVNRGDVVSNALEVR